jgi:hypothetical protein
MPLASVFFRPGLGHVLTKPTFSPGSITYCLISYSGEATPAS